MHTPVIAVVNKATVPLGVDLNKLVAAASDYVACVKSFWGMGCTLSVVKEVPANAWSIVFLDDADVQDALGYHDVTPNGFPCSKVFVKTAITSGEKPCVTFSHELAEMLVDPFTEQLTMNLNTGDVFPKEVCDAVEEESFNLRGIPFSNFVLPEWFQSWQTTPLMRYDFMGHLKAPFALSSGGYASILRNGNFTDVFGSFAKAERFAKEDRRGHRTTLWKANVAKHVLPVS